VINLILGLVVIDSKFSFEQAKQIGLTVSHSLVLTLSLREIGLRANPRSFLLQFD
jgi:hypothetical protein